VEQVLPASRDWSGSQYSTPVVSQGDCGSCYAVSSVDAMTMRVRIARNDSAMAKFSTQHVLTCSAMNQGCSGGFPWLVGYHASHEGLVSSTCDVDYSDVAEPFVAGPEPRCDDEQKCERTYAVNYGYVGGYYGRGNAADMMWSLERDGPLVVAVNPGPHFQVYRSGLFVASKNTSPRDYVQFVDAYWERTTHAVVLVGYGSMMVDGQLVPTWKVKNSWGETWGDRGYFHIQRGVDAIAVESMPVHVSFSTTPGNPDFETQVRAKLDLPATDPRCRAVIESMLKTGFL
jgi:cathepsin C